MNLARQLYAAGLGVFPCSANKAPAIKKGEDWRELAKQPPDSHTWRSGIVGVPVPPGVVIIDLDTYKGITREIAEQTLGCSLQWDRALVQATQRGGQHYAFSVDWPVRQDTDWGLKVHEVKGLDTRVSGKGYIATGKGYTPVGFGVYAMAHPSALPRLPDACRALLEHVDHTPTEHVALPEGDKDLDTLRQALSYISPSSDRTKWVKIGLALRHHFHDDEPTGLAIFDEWSRGALTKSGEEPANYSAETMESQWYSFKVEGGTTIGTLYHNAISAGWNPPAGIDTALAFGGTEASAHVFDEVVDRIMQEGGNPKCTNDLIAAVHSVACNELQRGILLAALNRELKDAGLLTKAVRKLLEGKKPPRPQNEYGQNHTENAIMFLDFQYPDQTICRSEQVWYAYDGKSWVELDDADMKHNVAVALVPSMPQHSTVTGTYGMIEALSHNSIKKIGDTPPGLVLMQNGVLDLHTGQMLIHSREYFTTNILPYDYNPHARCPRWTEFLNEIFENDQERVALLQEWLGYMMSSSYDHQKIMLLLGPRRCGKGTIGHVMKMIIGKANYSGGTLASFADDAFIDSLRTKTAIFIGDAAKNIPRNKIDDVIERIKGISGCDDQKISRKWKSTLSEQLPTRITIAGNHIPKLFDDSGAMAGRLLVLPMNVSWYGREDPALLDKLSKEIEGIAIWALQGMARLNQNGKFTMPAESQAETEYITESYSPLQMFLKAGCVLGGDNFASAADVYNSYKSWAVLQQEDHILARRTFISSFKDVVRGTICKYCQRRIGDANVTGFKGITLKIQGEAGNVPLTAVK